MLDCIKIKFIRAFPSPHELKSNLTVLIEMYTFEGLKLDILN